MKNASAFVLTLAAAALLAACDSDSKPPTQKVRPVLSAVAERETGAGAAFAGAIEPRYSSRLAFRVLGRVIERNVNTGDSVKKGARLAALDPVPFDLAVRDARAGLANAEAQLVNAQATERRRKTLFEEKHIPPQQLEAVQQARAAAEAAVTQARAALDKALEQRGYTVLSPEFDGIVTAVNVEIGQVVTAGQPVITVARPDVREAVIDVPDDAAASLRAGSPFEAALQIDPSKRSSGRVREIAPKVDALTRSQRVKITLDDPPADFRLGTNITAYALERTTGRIEIPAAALFDQDGKQHVWIVNPAAKTVSLREVQISSRDGKGAIVTAGLQPGDRVVTAGVHSLAPGQSVKIPEETQQ
jgi:RND family efflux transporter MFP subunit